MVDELSDPKPVHDGRFGERFDDEVPTGSVVILAVAIAFACAVGMLITWVMLGRNVDRAEALTPPPSPVAEANVRRLPEGPLLQADPEAEYQEMLAEMEVELHDWGWVDEGRGIVRIPIDTAIDLMVERAKSDASETSDASATAEATTE